MGGLSSYGSSINVYRYLSMNSGIKVILIDVEMHIAVSKDLKGRLTLLRDVAVEWLE